MNSHQIAVAKASFSAGLLRPDPTSVPRTEITCFHDDIDTMLTHCSPARIQVCKSWLLKNVVPSAARVGGLGKYLVALAGSFQQSEREPQQQSLGQPDSNSRISSKRKILHIFYLLNDLLHHTKYHTSVSSTFPTVAESLRPYLNELFGLAGSYDAEQNPKHHKRLRDVLDIWENNGYYSTDYVQKLLGSMENFRLSRESDFEKPGEGLQARQQKGGLTKGPPFMMPATHGDPNAPYHELPAGNMLPHIIPDSTATIRPQSVKALHFVAGPADESLVKAVKGLLEQVDHIYNTNGRETRDITIVDIDELGSVTTRDNLTGELIDEGSYYGWSPAFCQNMKRRKAGKTRGRSRSASRSSSQPTKMRRHSDSLSDDDRGRSRSRSSSVSSDNHRRDPYSSRSPRRSGRERGYSPRPPSLPPPPSQAQFIPQPPPDSTQVQTHSQPPARFPYPSHQQYHMPYQPPQLQAQPPPPQAMFPPPPPPNYTGHWPPPPPIPGPGPGGLSFPPVMPGFPQFHQPQTIGGQQFMPHPPPPPPPPPPPSSSSYQMASHPYNPLDPPPQQGQNQQRYQGSGGWNRGGWS
ncbi:hypothetical protein FQN57_004832 [Myotisia sp. PD_48]|nr:hypothetical protein FQN57_004832 [Myotisia sp. PD_48]